MEEHIEVSLSNRPDPDTEVEAFDWYMNRIHIRILELFAEQTRNEIPRRVILDAFPGKGMQRHDAKACLIRMIAIREVWAYSDGMSPTVILNWKAVKTDWSPSSPWAWSKDKQPVQRSDWWAQWQRN